MKKFADKKFVNFFSLTFACKHYMRKKNFTKHEYLVCSGNRDGYKIWWIRKDSIRCNKW